MIMVYWIPYVTVEIPYVTVLIPYVTIPYTKELTSEASLPEG